MKKFNKENRDELKEQIKTKQEDGKQTVSLALSFSLILFGILVVTLSVSSVLIYILVRTNVIPITGNPQIGVGRMLILLMVSSLVVGFIIALVVKNFQMDAIDQIVNQLNGLASGDYTVRIKFGKPFRGLKALQKVKDSFNKMAEELQNTEMLRSDFVNNFSHEFKTPIVSIAGFAKLLKRGNLTEEQKKEYIDVIEEESMRLSQMATNVLNLTRIENQTILTDVTTFNLSEQLRSCILLLEGKWTKKNIEMFIDFGEYEISANEELLKHVWINLLDNAVKFSPDNGIIGVNISQEWQTLSVSISNNGEPIPDEALGKIFHKFYQGDESHASAGNGIGLAIVKRVVDLHNGAVFAESRQNLTTFTVKLPINQ